MGNEQTRHDEVVESTADTERTMQPQRVPINVYESAGALVIVAPFPAVTASDVTIELNGSRLRFFARLRSAGPREYLVHEWEYGATSAKSTCRMGTAEPSRPPSPTVNWWCE